MSPGTGFIQQTFAQHSSHIVHYLVTLKVTGKVNYLQSLYISLVCLMHIFGSSTAFINYIGCGSSYMLCKCDVVAHGVYGKTRPNCVCHKYVFALCLLVHCKWKLLLYTSNYCRQGLFINGLILKGSVPHTTQFQVSSLIPYLYFVLIKSIYVISVRLISKHRLLVFCPQYWNQMHYYSRSNGNWTSFQSGITFKVKGFLEDKKILKTNKTSKFALQWMRYFSLVCSID